jgi:hypothetical protein
MGGHFRGSTIALYGRQKCLLLVGYDDWETTLSTLLGTQNSRKSHQPNVTVNRVYESTLEVNLVCYTTNITACNYY